jgi:3-oxoacyl-[acyl-carrier-protein] synthase II
VVTGVGTVTPLGCGAERLLARWLAGESGISGGFGRCDDFEPADFMSRKDARRTDRFSQLAVAAAREALDQAGWTAGLPVAAEDVGCVIGTGFGGIETVVKQVGICSERGEGSISPLTIPLMMANAAPGMISLLFGLKGPAYSVGSACAAGSDAIGSAARMIAEKRADAMVAGGSDACLTRIAIAATARAGALSKSGVSRPFDARRDGFVLGEGAGVLVLEAAEVAEARGATVLGEVLGYGASVDAFHLAAPDPSGDGARRAIEGALRDAGVEPRDLDYVNAHGTSTQLNDRAETEALKAALGPVAHELPVSSTKSVIGHLCGGAGAVEAAVTLLALRRRVAPPTVGHEQPDEGLDLNYVPGVPQPLTGRAPEEPAIAISNSFGFGGHNAVLCLAAA